MKTQDAAKAKSAKAQRQQRGKRQQKSAQQKEAMSASKKADIAIIAFHNLALPLKSMPEGKTAVARFQGCNSRQQTSIGNQQAIINRQQTENSKSQRH